MDPVRGWNEDLTELERALLEAARSDRAPEALAAHMARALPGGAAATSATSDAAAPAATAPPTATAATAATGGAASKLTAPLFVKAGLWGVLAIGLVFAGAASWQRATAPRPTNQIQAQSTSAATRTAEAPLLSARDAPAAEPWTRSGQAPSSPSVKGPAAAVARDVPAQASEVANENDPLLEEVGLLGRVRDALRRRMSARALRLLDQHAVRFRRGTLTPEAAVLRIEALVQQGKHEQATARSERFVQRYPAHPLRARAQALVEPTAAR